MSLIVKGKTVVRGTTRVGNAVFDPTSLANLTGWWDASDAASITISSGTSVSQINDKSGNGYHATQPTGGNQPTITSNAQNGKSVLTFNGTSSFLKVANITLPIGMSLFAAVQTTTAKPMFFEQGTNAYASSGFYFLGTNNSSWCSHRGGVVYAPGVLNWLGSSFAVADLIVDRTTGATKYYLNNSVQSNNGQLGTFGAESNLTADFYIFSRAGTSVFSSGKLGELLIYSRTLTAAEQSAVRAYLKAKWATP